MRFHSLFQLIRRGVFGMALLFGSALLNAAVAQEVRYSWFEIGYVNQTVDRTGFKADFGLNQVVDIDAQDGPGVRFRGSIGTWNNMYAFFDFSTVDPDVDAVVTNAQGVFEASDEFDLTSVRTGVGLKYSMGLSTDLYAEVSFDSVTYDFGSFATENFDVDQRDFGGAVGIRHMFNDDFEGRAHARYTNVGDVDLTNSMFESDVLYGAGFSWQVIRGLSITGDYEFGEVATWSVGFRLDMDED